MLRNASDEELRELMRHLAKVAGLSLDEKRIQYDLPQFRVQLGWVETLNSFHLPMESEPAPVMRLARRRRKAKK